MSDESLRLSPVDLPELPPATRADSLLERLAERLGGSARAAAIFGDPVERDGVTVIPVAKARWGLGGGSGAQPTGQSGTGGGGGLILSPVGYVEIAGGHTRFRRIGDPTGALPLLLASGLIAILALRSLERLLRGERVGG